jgi:hypothetical protein
MNQKEEKDAPHEETDECGFAAHVFRRYRQVLPAQEPRLKAEVYRAVIFDTLRLSNVSPRPMEINAVDVDWAFPLRLAVTNAPELFRLADFPMLLANGASVSLLLRSTSISPIIQRFCYAPVPAKITVTTGAGPLVFQNGIFFAMK